MEDVTRVRFGVLGPLTAQDADGAPLDLKGPRHRAVLARLIVARRRVVPVARLVDDLWDEPPAGAVGAVQTFVGALRRALEPGRPPRAPARLLVTDGPGYALRAAPDAVDAWRFEATVERAPALPPAEAVAQLEQALALWRGPAYAEAGGAQAGGAQAGGAEWARADRARLAELRLQAVERRAGALLALGRAARAVPDLRAHLTDHPWREEAWRLLALAQYRAGSQGDALEVLREARSVLAGRLGLDPGAGLRRLEADILAQAPELDGGGERDRAGTGGTTSTPGTATPVEAAAHVWARAAEAYDRTLAATARARLEGTVGLMRNLAVTGGEGLRTAARHRVEAIAAAEEFGDPELTARVIGAYDVPAVWTRSDEPPLAARVVAAAERALAALAALPAGAEAARCRLLATIALEMRGTREERGPEAARAAEDLARRLGDPTLLAFALNGRFMQSCRRAGQAPERDAIGAELVRLATRHGLVTFEVLGHLVRLQSACASADFTAADAHAAAADRLAERHELPLVGVFTEWYAALRLAAHGHTREAESAYRAAAERLDGAGMPGLQQGLLPLALLCLRLAEGGAVPPVDLAEDWGPYRPWAEPFAHLATGHRGRARAALRALPEPPADLLYEALCCLEAFLAQELDDQPALSRARSRLRPAAGELAGAGSGLLTLGPVARYLDAPTDR